MRTAATATAWSIAASPFSLRCHHRHRRRPEEASFPLPPPPLFLVTTAAAAAEGVVATRRPSTRPSTTITTTLSQPSSIPMNICRSFIIALRWDRRIVKFCLSVCVFFSLSISLFLLSFYPLPPRPLVSSSSSSSRFHLIYLLILFFLLRRFWWRLAGRSSPLRLAPKESIL